MGLFLILIIVIVCINIYFIYIGYTREQITYIDYCNIKSNKELQTSNHKCKVQSNKCIANLDKKQLNYRNVCNIECIAHIRYDCQDNQNINQNNKQCVDTIYTDYNILNQCFDNCQYKSIEYYDMLKNNCTYEENRCNVDTMVINTMQYINCIDKYPNKDLYRMIDNPYIDHKLTQLCIIMIILLFILFIIMYYNI